MFSCFLLNFVKFIRTPISQNTSWRLLPCVRETWLQVQNLAIILRRYFPSDISQLKVNNRNTTTRCKICSQLTLKIPERRYRLWTYFIPCSGLFIVNFEHVISGCVRDRRQISLAILTLSWRGPLSYGNLSIDLQSNGLITAFVMKELSEFKWIN